MSSLAKLGKGTKLYLGGATSPASYNAIPEVLEISGAPGGTPDLIDVTNHDTVGLYKEEITGLITLNDMTCRANYIDNQYQNDLEDLMNAGTVSWYKIEIPGVNGTITVLFQARVRGWQVVTPLNAQQELQFTLKPFGAAIWTGRA
jgi:hypothetical protein